VAAHVPHRARGRYAAPLECVHAQVPGGLVCVTLADGISQVRMMPCFAALGDRRLWHWEDGQNERVSDQGPGVCSQPDRREQFVPSPGAGLAEHRFEVVVDRVDRYVHPAGDLLG
jgi:hypothetical protein